MTETLKRRTLDLATLMLAKGAHHPDHTFCVMEAVAFIAGEPWTDTPECVSPTIGAFLRNWNDSVDDAFRQRLKPYIERVLDTRTTAADEETRAWLATDWLVRVHAPAWLELAGLTADATALRNLPALTSSEIAVAVQSVLEGARQRAAAAWDAASVTGLRSPWHGSPRTWVVFTSNVVGMRDHPRSALSERANNARLPSV